MTNHLPFWGELLTRISVWLALVGYLFGPLSGLLGREVAGWQRTARWVYSLGWLAFVVHVVAAFAFFYDWSHSVALVETARQTFEATGHDSGAGLYLNYLFAALWALDIAWWWQTGDQGFRRRPAWVGATLHGFFLFMAFNATVVFEQGAVRWAGWIGTLLILVAVALSRFRRRR